MNAPTTPKFCKNCAHYSQLTVHLPRCAAPEAIILDPVLGEIEGRCFEVRLHTGACGAEARLFTAKKATVAARLLRSIFGKGSRLP